MKIPGFIVPAGMERFVLPGLPTKRSYRGEMHVFDHSALLFLEYSLKKQPKLLKGF